MFLSTLLAGTQSDFLTTTLPILRTVFFIIVVLCAIVILITVLLQSNDATDGMETITGSQESYYAQNKGSSRDGKLKIVTIVMSIIAMLCIIAFFITELVNRIS